MPSQEASEKASDRTAAAALAGVQSSEPDGDRQARAALTALVAPGDALVGRWITRFGAAHALARVLAQAPALRQRATALWGDELPLTSLSRSNARLLIPGDQEWPTQLGDLGESMPFGLWAIGEANLRLLALRSISIVGARAATAYGERIAREWASMLADAGWTIVSGGALGIDGAAHRGALEANGVTICVLACGPDVAYPAANTAMLSRIVDQGVLVSEAPPGTPARRHRFLTRNRVIATMSRATVVVEAARRSGTTATAHAAFLANRPVAAVPGPVGSIMSAGCHRMIREGAAVLVASSEDVLELVQAITPHALPAKAGERARSPAGQHGIHPLAEPAGRTSAGLGRSSGPDRPTDGLPHDVLRVLDALRPGTAVSVDAIILETGLPPRAVAAALGELVVRGLASSLAAGWILGAALTRRGGAASVRTAPGAPDRIDPDG